ncbi:MAG TPA: hypothetical protein VIR60_08000 [Gammaproteobacteria bacterium]
MTPALIAEVELFNNIESAWEPARIYENAGDCHVDDIEAKWLPELRSRAAEVRRKHIGAWGLDHVGYQRELGELNIQDSHWDWRRKFVVNAGNLSVRSFVLEADGSVQAVMSLAMGERCKIASQVGQHLAYVEYLSVAPWNRKPLRDPRVYKGIGTTMIQLSVAISQDEEFQGRVGLHSLSQAEPFYRGCGMTDLDIDPNKEGLRYFEFTPDQAVAYSNGNI